MRAISPYILCVIIMMGLVIMLLPIQLVLIALNHDCSNETPPKTLSEVRNHYCPQKVRFYA